MKEYKNHTFVICAYKESRYLEKCIESVINQTVKSNIIITTSTPNDYIKEIAGKYNIELYINTGEKGIGQDWNFGVSTAKTDYVTITHQDDIYKENYLEEIVKRLEKNQDFVIAITKYNEIKNDIEIPLNTNLKIKEFLLFPLKFFNKSKICKMFSLAFGNAISCPTVTVNKKIVGDRPYKTELKCSLDWDTWLELTKYKGRYLYIPKYLMSHRIHEESETTSLIENNVRLEEDYIMFKKMWPEFIAKLLMKQYKNSVKTNKV